MRVAIERAAEREAAGISLQIAAARERLLRELGKYLVSLGQGTGDLNQLLFQQLQRQEIASRQRLELVRQRLGSGYPEWPAHLLEELSAYDQAVTLNERRGRLIGKELDAALADPRWAAAPP